MVGTHLHQGTITMVCLEGSVRYLEYDWTASRCGLILETPGESHTLVTEAPQRREAVHWMQGLIEFYDDDGKFADTGRRLVVHQPLRDLLPLARTAWS